jgi:small-conductance mechanosensitive channel
MIRHMMILTLLLVLSSLLPVPAFAQDAGAAKELEVVAPVVVDGTRLFDVSGVSAFPAEKRAQLVAGRIRDAAADRSITTNDTRVVRKGDIVGVYVRDTVVVGVTDTDAAREGISQDTLASVYVLNMTEAVARYRQARTVSAVVAGIFRTLVATVIAALLVLLVQWIRRRLDDWYDRRYKERIEHLQIKSFDIGKAGGLWTALNTIRRVVRFLALLFIAVFYVSYVLGQFIWTKPFAVQFVDLILDPLRAMAVGVVGSIPNMVFLFILVAIFRYVLKLTRLLFSGIRNGSVHWHGFDPDWAEPTYQIVRVLVVVFGVVVAYPYIPGSQSAAFKGISVFIGVMFSIGSSTAISNLLAGYSMVYRRAFKQGDRVRIGETFGEVVEMQLMVTRLRSLKNEEIVMPNSQILNSTVINYTSMAKQKGLILHTTVGIGYETPWRKVEAMLLLAADRTTGFLKEPKPFVMQQSLGDFAVTYEINVFTDHPENAPKLYTALHANILDVFNEYNVQIMTPAYEGDPAQAKVVPKDQWFSAPAKPPEGQAAG